MSEAVLRPQVCIVGAGPAGAAASLTLSQKGIAHLVVEADHFPRHKPCGDILTSPAIRAMNRLDPDLLEALKAAGQVNPIWQTHTFPPNGKPITIDFLPLDGREGIPSCYSVSRWDLDLLLSKKIQSTGFARLETGCRVVEVERKEGIFHLRSESGLRIETPMLVVATGSSPNFLRLLQISLPKEDCAIGIRGHFRNLDWPMRETGLFLEDGIMPGGLYITPLPDQTCNVNLVLSLRQVSAESISLRDAFQAFTARHPELKDRFAHAERVGNFEGSMLYLGLRRHQVYGDGFLVAGDSAGLIEFFSGNGIPQAFISGQMAGQHAAAALERGRFSAIDLAPYEKALYAKIRLNPAAGKMVFPLLHRPFFKNWVLNFLDHLAARPRTNGLLRELMYAREPGKLLRKPGFLYDLLIRKG
jgi:flavin-dependent dehydrogenase